MIDRFLQDGDVVVITRADNQTDGEFKHVIIESRRLSGIYDFTPSAAADYDYNPRHRFANLKMHAAADEYNKTVDQILARNGWSDTEISQRYTYDLRTILTQIKMANTVIELANEYFSGKASYWDIYPFIPCTPGGWKESELPTLVSKCHAGIEKLSPFAQMVHSHVLGFGVKTYGDYSRVRTHVRLHEAAIHHHHDTPVEYHANDVVVQLIDKVGGKTNLRREMLKLAETSKQEVDERIGVITAEFDQSLATKRILVKIISGQIGAITLNL